MSAECHEHGCDLVYGPGMEMICQVCEVERERDAARASLRHLALGEVTDDMLARAIAAYHECGRVDCEADFQDAMREALHAALNEAPS
jgi:hypothetical protein